MAIDYGMLQRFGERPSLAQDLSHQYGQYLNQQNRLAQLAQQQELQGYQMRGLQRAEERAPIEQARADLAYQQQQEQRQAEASRRQQEAEKLQGFRSTLTPEEQMALDISPKAFFEAKFAKPEKPVFVAELGGYVQPPSREKPAGAFMPVPGVTKKEKEVNWQSVQTDQGIVQVHPQTGQVRSLGIQQPKKTAQAALSPTAQKELFEAEDIAQSSQNVMSLLDEAKKLNEKAYSGVGAKTRAVIRSNIPGESEAANATIALDNLMTGQALESLKATFGGMPTEGERKILLDIQASAEKTPKQRADIMERAKKAAENRLKFSQEKSKKLRSGEYFSPETQTETLQPAEITHPQYPGFSIAR